MRERLPKVFEDHGETCPAFSLRDSWELNMSPGKTQIATSDRPYRVLALDGGGMRGLYTATVLDTLAGLFARERGVASLDVGRGFDLIVGTSIGGLIACALAVGRSTRQIVDFFPEYGPQIFTNPIPLGPLRKLLWAIRCWRRAANSNETLRKALEITLGSETLAEVYERRGISLCIPTVDLATQTGRVFKTPHHRPMKQRDNNWSLVEVCVATSAAPIFLPVSVCGDPDAPGNFAFTDGGLLANNPALIGLVEALSIAPRDQSVEVVSIGTCPPPVGSSVPTDTACWGLSDWKAGTGILNTLLNVQAQSVGHIINLLLPYLGRECSFVRVPQTAPSPEQAECLGLDATSAEALRILRSLGKHDADQVHSRARSKNQSELSIVAKVFGDIPENKLKE